MHSNITWKIIKTLNRQMMVMAVIGLNQKWMQYMQVSVLVVRLKGATAFVINAILNLTALNINAVVVVCVGVGVVVRIDAAKNEK